MRGTIKLVNLYFWKSFYGPFFAFGLSFIFIFIVTAIWSLAGEIIPNTVLPSCYTMVILSISLIVIPISINDLRMSMLLKRMGSSPVRPSTFLVTIIVYYYIVIFVSYIWQILLSYLVIWNYRGYITDMLKVTNYFYLWYAITLTYAMSLSIGFFLLIICHRNFQIQLVSIIIILISFILAGLGIPIAIIHSAVTNNAKPVLSSIVYYDPFWYTSCLNYQAWFANPDPIFNIYGSSMFDPSQMLLVKLGTSFNATPVLDEFDKYMALFMPVGIITIFGLFSGLTFRWNRRS